MPPAIPDKISCDTEQQLQRELEDLRNALDRDETEESWEQMQRALTRCKSLIRGGAYKHDSFVPSLKSIGGLVSRPLLSERGRLSAAAIELLSTLASALGRRFDPLMHLFMPPLIKLCQRPNKVVINRTTACTTTIIQHTRLPSILTYLRDAVKDKSVQLRTVSSEAVLLCLTHIEPDKIGSRVADIEAIIKTTGRDANPEVRKNARGILKQYQERWPERYLTFISPLSPVSRKYLDVQNSASVAKEPAPPLKLFPPTTKPPPNPRIDPGRTVDVNIANYKLPTSNSGLSSRPPSRAARAQAIVETSLPPRPHSVASMGPRQPPIARAATDASVSALRNATIARPLSVDMTLLASSLPKVPRKEPEYRQDLINGGLNRGKELHRQQSRDNPLQQPPISATVEQYSHGANPADRQRSNLVFNGREDAERATRVLTASQPLNMEPFPKKEEVYSRTRTISSSRTQAPEFFQPPRPLSRSNDNAAFVRPNSRVATRSKNETIDHVSSTRPISIASTTLESTGPSSITERNGNLSSNVTQSNMGPELRTPFYTETKPVSFPSQTPRSLVERPTVVYLPTTATEVAVDRPRPAKSWSLSHQLELLKKRKRAGGQRGEDPSTQQTDIPQSDTNSPDQLEFPTLTNGNGDAQKSQDAPPFQAQPGQPPRAEDKPNNDDVTVVLPVAFPSEEDIGPPITPTLSIQTAMALAPTTQGIFISESPSAPSDTMHGILGAAHPERDRTVSVTSNPPVRPRVISTTSIASAPVTRPRVISNSSKAPPTRQRVISTSSNPAQPSKEILKVPIRAPLGRPDGAPAKHTGFVPKRTVKNSITQPTKSQAARAQAMLNEKAAAHEAAGKVASAGTTAKTMTNPQHCSPIDTAPSHTQNIRNAQRPAGGFAPVSRKGTGLTDSQNRKQDQNKGAVDSVPPAMSTRVRAESRKPPVPTVSSLVKTHAARREAALASVEAKNGKPTVAPKMKPAARAASRQPKPIRKIVNPSDRGAGSDATHLNPTHGVVPPLKQQDGKDGNGLHRSTASTKGDEHNEVTRPSQVSERAKSPVGVAMPETTLPLLSSSFTITDETAGIKLKQVGQAYTSPSRDENLGGAILLNELRAS